MMVREIVAGTGYNGQIIDPAAAAKHTLRAIAKRWLALDAEIKTHEQIPNRLTAELVSDLVAAFGIDADIAAEMLIVAGGNLHRIWPVAGVMVLVQPDQTAYWCRQDPRRWVGR